MITLIIILIILALLLFLLFNSVKVSVFFKRCEKENNAELTVKYLFIKKSIPLKKTEKKEKKPEKTEKKELPEQGIKYYYSLYKNLKDDVFDVLKYLKNKAAVFEMLSVKLDFGYSDAALTGIMTGTFNGLIYNTMAYFHNNFKVKDWNVEINPDFENDKFDVECNCIVKLKTVHIIGIAFKGLKILIKKSRADKKGRK